LTVRREKDRPLLKERVVVGRVAVVREPEKLVAAIDLHDRHR
jgi:hypothetical protein